MTGIWQTCEYVNADMAELADAIDLGSIVQDVQVQVLLSAGCDGSRKSKIFQ